MCTALLIFNEDAYYKYNKAFTIIMGYLMYCLFIWIITEYFVNKIKKCNEDEKYSTWNVLSAIFLLPLFILTIPMILAILILYLIIYYIVKLVKELRR